MSVAKELRCPIDFHSMFYMKPWACLVPDILQNIFFCVQQKKEIPSGFEHLEGE